MSCVCGVFVVSYVDVLCDVQYSLIHSTPPPSLKTSRLGLERGYYYEIDCSDYVVWCVYVLCILYMCACCVHVCVCVCVVCVYYVCVCVCVCVCALCCLI